MARNGTEQVRQLQRTLYRTSKQSKAVKFYSLHDKVWRTDVLREAWEQVKANRGAPGVDGESIEGIESRGEEESMLSRLQQELRAKTYRFQPVRRVDIPKPKGGTRPLGIATVEDRVVQTAMKLVLEPIFEADFHNCSYGYRPQRNAKMACKAIRKDLYQRAWGVVEIDFRSYFTTIAHAKLMVLIKQRVVDGSMLRLIKQSLTVGVAYQGNVEPTKVGVPQGSPTSPLYSNIYLNLLDQVLQKRDYPEKLGATLHRYADDAILICRRSGTQALQAFEAIAKRMELTVNLDKTRITKLTEGFDFIGFEFVKRRSPTSGKPCISGAPAGVGQLGAGETRPQGEQRLRRRSVGAVQGEAPAARHASRAHRLAMRGEPREIGIAQALGARRAQSFRPRGGEKLGMAFEREGLLDRVGDHQRLTLGAARGESADRLFHRRRIGEEIADQRRLGSRLERGRRRQACGDGAAPLLGRHGFSEAFDDVASGERRRQADQPGALAAAHRQISQRERQHRGAVDLGAGRKRRGVGHRRRAIEPDPDRMRGLPFALAHERAVLARRAAPVDPRRRLAGDEGAKLPEGFAWPRLASAMHAMQQRMGDLARRDDEARQARRQRRGLVADASL